MKNIFLKTVLFCLIVFGFAVASAEASEVSLSIRDGSSIIFSGPITLPEPGSIDVNDSNGVSHAIDAQSVLAVVSVADEADANWSISDLTFFDSFGSFYIKCINYSGGEKCDNWQYVVDGTSPFSSIDQKILSGGEEVYLYFGYPHRVTLSASSVQVNQSFTATAESYDYENDSWGPLNGVTIGITQPNPSDAFNPTEIMTETVDGSGVATFSLAVEGSYNVGIKEDFYFPTVPLSVTPVPVSSGGGGGGGGGGSSSGGSGGSSGSSVNDDLPTFEVKDALEFLQEEANENGSFGRSDLYTDWVAIAYGAANVKGEPYDKIISYLNSITTPGETLTDNVRRAMALLSLKQNPYSFGGINYIELIVKDFDNVQFGEPDLVNDDIFAIIALLGAGYTIEDEIISSDVKFILSEQKTNGSWEGSIDLTAAAVQALQPFIELEEVEDALLLAGKYLKSTQKEDGGWGSVYSASWVLQAEDVLKEEWTKNRKSGENYLAVYQAGDGGVLSKKDKNENRIWATSYAIPGVLGKSWIDIMERVPKQEVKGASIEVKPADQTTALQVPAKKEIPALALEALASPQIQESASLETETIMPSSQVAAVVKSETSGKVATSFAFGLGLGLGLGILLRKLKFA